MNRFVLDLIERVLATYAEAFCGLLLASLVDAPGVVNVSLIEKAAIAALPAAVAVLKAVIGGLVGNKDSAALLPASVDVPATPQLVILPTVTGEVAQVSKAATATRKPVKKSPSKAKVSKGTVDPAP